jgi:membrane protein YdbS with pleckstrin-like domain
MGRRVEWREDESHIITVTPVAKGLVRPSLVALVLAVLVQEGSFHWHFVHHHEALFLLVLVGPVVVVVATRTWRWRSHKIQVTSQRVIVEGGVANHFRTSVELADVYATRVDQRVSERLSRRGTVLLETGVGTFYLGRVRHPAALCRLIDRERRVFQVERVPLDTVFEFDDPSSHDYEVNPRRRWGHQA